MRKTATIGAGVVLVLLLLPGASRRVRAQDVPYATMAPLEQYLMPRDAEIALARSAAPASIADGANVMVLGQHGYTTAVAGTNGFLCLVERSWANATTAPDFWNPKERAPNCFNAAAAGSFEKIYLMKTKLVLAGKSRKEIAHAISAALDSRELPALAPGSMCFMTSKHQYLNDRGKSWYPHLMFFVAGDAEKSWGGNLPGSPVIAVNNPEARATVFMVVVGHWSDGTPAPH